MFGLALSQEISGVLCLGIQMAIEAAEIRALVRQSHQEIGQATVGLNPGLQTTDPALHGDMVIRSQKASKSTLDLQVLKDLRLENSEESNVFKPVEECGSSLEEIGSPRIGESLLHKPLAASSIQLVADVKHSAAHSRNDSLPSSPTSTLDGPGFESHMLSHRQANKLNARPHVNCPTWPFNANRQAEEKQNFKRWSMTFRSVFSGVQAVDLANYSQQAFMRNEQRSAMEELQSVRPFHSMNEPERMNIGDVPRNMLLAE